jgi:hypothetical protein
VTVKNLRDCAPAGVAGKDVLLRWGRPAFLGFEGLEKPYGGDVRRSLGLECPLAYPLPKSSVVAMRNDGDWRF